MRVLVGLGNPGSKYSDTRHNVGFMTIDHLGGIFAKKVKKKGFMALYEEFIIGGEKIILFKPQTYMNDSGNAVGSIMGYYHLNPSDFFIIYDDLDLPFGRIRIREKGGSGGHNGMKSIIAALGTEDFPRLRIGIGGGGKGDGNAVINHVLSGFNSIESKHLDKIINLAVDASETYIRDGLMAAMNRFNSTEIMIE